jgi:OOP family OmpA-OmpF porin
MKNLNKIFIAAAIILALNVKAQDSKKQWAISFGVNAIDTKTSAGGGNNWLDYHVSQPLAIKENWNVLPSISYIGVSKYISDNFSFGVSGSANKLSKFVTFNPTSTSSERNSRGYLVTNPGDLSFYGIDTYLKYSFQSLIKSKSFEPTASFGAGYSFLGDSSFGTLNTGIGVTYWMTENLGFELASTYRKSFGERAIGVMPDAPSFLQHSFGLVFKFGESKSE